ncbi:MAG: DUF1674 domain-containing protein [Ectothiorhodospiraceae bacterium]|nr:DUF1674 domain-containing protein [Ectothiorhodospiraceae bacterium]MCH8505121.1 DUF1674 domain-containing protein [Ectothiorhodospiraceae bacterium]
MSERDDKPDAAAGSPAREGNGRNAEMKPGKPETWPREIGGQEGPEPTRYGDWEKNGRCTDF